MKHFIFLSFLVAVEIRAEQSIAKATQCEVRGSARECTIDLRDFNIQDDPQTIQLDIHNDGTPVNCARIGSRRDRTNYWYGDCGGSREVQVSWLGDRIHATYTGDEVCVIHKKQGRGKMDCVPKTEEELPDEEDALIEDDINDNRFLRASKNKDRQLDNGSVIDIMIVWTKQAECEESGYAKTCTPDSVTEASMQDLANAAVNQANIAFDVSGIKSEFRLVHAFRDPDYVESTNLKTRFNEALYDLRDSERVHVERVRYRADVVSLFISKGGSCGLAFTGPGTSTSNADRMYSVVNRNCATSKYTLTHELGHNLGAYHDRYNMPGSHCNSNGYNYGWTDRTNGIRTVMSGWCGTQDCDGDQLSGTCDRVLHFSSPDYPYNGSIVIGDERHDNARKISENVVLAAGRYTGWNCFVDDDCDDGDASTMDTCNTSNNGCKFTLATHVPTNSPPSPAPTSPPTPAPTSPPTPAPTLPPTPAPTLPPTPAPTSPPTPAPTSPPTPAPTSQPTPAPTSPPTPTPTIPPTPAPARTTSPSTPAPVIVAPDTPAPVSNLRPTPLETVETTATPTKEPFEPEPWYLTIPIFGSLLRFFMSLFSMFT